MTTHKGQIEYRLLRQGHCLVGVDEVGKGCIAGPVYAASVILDYQKLILLPNKLKEKIRDSKTLSHKQRSEIVPIIEEVALETSVASAKVAEIEAFGIAPATFLAIKRALEKLRTQFSYLLIDGNQSLESYKIKQKAIIKGDSLCYNIAAASILAKEARDTFMRKQASKFPVYGFEKHVGYGTKFHISAIMDHGACSLHRKNFAPVKNFFSP